MTQREIIGLYESLSQLPRDEQRKHLGSLSSQVKAALWTHNIQRFLDSHPELDMAAQDLLREIMSVAAKSETFEVGVGSSSFEAHQTMLEAYSRRAESLMQRRAIYESLGRLGPEPRYGTRLAFCLATLSLFAFAAAAQLSMNIG